MEQNIRLYRTRWIVLSVFLFINLTIQLLWISYAPITSIAADFYGVKALQIGFLSMVFMIAFIPFSIPASWVIDTYGFRTGVSIAAVLLGVCGLLRGFAGANFTLVLLSTIGLAIAQPFILNAWTTLPAKWFSKNERATAVGLITLANLVGTAIGLVLTPILAENNFTIPQIQLMYGAIAAISSVLFLLLARENPPTPPCTEDETVRALMLEGLKHAVSIGSFWIFIFISFLGLSIFNGITTWVEAIIKPTGFSSVEAGMLGDLMLHGGVIGAVVMPIFSDKTGRRKPFIQLGVALSIPGLLGLAFFDTLIPLYLSAFSVGFFMISVSPIGMQYVSEITHPTPEGTSNGMIQLFGQASFVFVYIMEAMRTPAGSFAPSLLLAAGLLLVGLLLTSRMVETARN